MVMWTENIKLLKKFKEGDAIKIIGVEIKQGFRADEAHLNMNSSIKKASEDEIPDLPHMKKK